MSDHSESPTPKNDHNEHPVVPVEIVTVTVTRSVRYVDTADINLALQAMRIDTDNRPENYDGDEVISHHVDVRLPSDLPCVVEAPKNASLHEVADLIEPWRDPHDCMPVGWQMDEADRRRFEKHTSR